MTTMLLGSGHGTIQAKEASRQERASLREIALLSTGFFGGMVCMEL